MLNFRTIGALLIGGWMCGGASLADAQLVSPLVSRREAERHGLERAWFTQVDVDRSTSRVTSVVYHGGSLFVQTDHASLHALDAATGRTIWKAQIGRPNHPSMAPAANDKYVAVVNGSQLIVVHRADGQLKWERRLNGGPGAGPALTHDRVFVPMINGRIEGYDLEDTKVAPWYYTSDGRAMVRPLATADSVCWTTDRGRLYVARSTNPGLIFRLDSDDAIECQAGYAKPYFFAAALDGFIYAVHENTGYQKWRFSTGDPISESPAGVDGHVYVCPERNGMFCIDSNTGQEVWWTPKVSKFLAASKEHVYGLDRFGKLYVLDGLNGSRISTFQTQGMTLSISNTQSDRIFLASPLGVVQCLHDLAQTAPLDYLTPAEAKDGAAPKPKTPQPAAEAGEGEQPAAEAPAAEEVPDADNPFGNQPAKADEAMPAEDAPPAGEAAPAAAPATDAASDDPFGEK